MYVDFFNTVNVFVKISTREFNITSFNERRIKLLFSFYEQNTAYGNAFRLKNLLFHQKEKNYYVRADQFPKSLDTNISASYFDCTHNL